VPLLPVDVIGGLEWHENEAEQMVSTVRQNGTPVWYLMTKTLYA
jgi:hypothetical protein